MSLAGLASIHGGISNQGWFIGLMCAIALLTLIVLIACFVNRNKGGKYSGILSHNETNQLLGKIAEFFCECELNPLNGSQKTLTDV